jgi:hypothetical protein
MSCPQFGHFLLLSISMFAPLLAFWFVNSGGGFLPVFVKLSLTRRQKNSPPGVAPVTFSEGFIAPHLGLCCPQASELHGWIGWGSADGP